MVDVVFDQPDVDFGRNFVALAERDIDFLLLEEFQVNDDFVRWFCGELDLLSITPGGTWHSVFDADGETDLLVRIHQGEDKVGVLIENKIAAIEQPGQPERYQTRGRKMVEDGKLARYLTVICAPQAYLAAHNASAYDKKIAYESIADWFASQSNPRAAWRAHVVREAIGQSRRGYAMVKDVAITEFQAKYWEHLQEHHPRLLMTKPGDRGPRSTWIILRGRGAPKGVHLNHLLNQNIMELAFTKTQKADLLATRPAWPDDIIVGQRGNEATIGLITRKIDIRSAFEEQIDAVEDAFQAAERLLQYANVLVKSNTSTQDNVGPAVADKQVDRFFTAFHPQNRSYPDT